MPLVLLTTTFLNSKLHVHEFQDILLGLREVIIISPSVSLQKLKLRALVN